MLTLALPKGRLADESVELLIKKKWLLIKPDESTRELTFTDSLAKVKILLVKAQDVATYVEECAADAGIIGWDTLKEGKYDLLSPVDLNIGKCRLSLAGSVDFDLKNYSRKIRVATKYPHLTKDFFFSKGLNCEIIKLYSGRSLNMQFGINLI